MEHSRRRWEPRIKRTRIEQGGGGGVVWAGVQAVQGTSQSKTELLSFSLFLLCFLCFSLSPSTQIIPSISLSSSSKGVGFPVSCSCLPPVPRNPHLPRHIETETPRRAVDTLSAETVHQLLCHHRVFALGPSVSPGKGPVVRLVHVAGGGGRWQVRPALQHGGEGHGLGSQPFIPTPLLVFWRHVSSRSFLLGLLQNWGTQPALCPQSTACYQRALLLMLELTAQ